MLGTIINAGAVVLGGCIGVLIKKGIPEKLSDAVMKGLALCVVYIGVSGALKAQNTLAMILSIVLGAVLGTLLDLDGRLERLGGALEEKLGKRGSGSTAEGFVAASLLFCVGAMSVVGSLQSGLTENHDMLFTKSLLDFISSIVLSSALGAGVVLSAASVLVFQGTITLLARLIAPVLSSAVIAEMTGVGSLLIIALGLNMLGATKIKVMNYLPAILIVIGLCRAI